MIKPLPLVLTALALYALPVTADVYTWTDLQGHAHYSDRPDDPGAAPVAVKSQPTDNSRIARQKQERIESRLRERTAETERVAEAEKQTANDERIAENCRRAEEALTSILNAQRVYVPQENGERRFLSDEEKQARIARARDDVDEWCNR